MIFSKKTVTTFRDDALLARDDEALGGHDHPAAVLAADGIDPAEARHWIAGIDLIHAVASLDQRNGGFERAVVTGACCIVAGIVQKACGRQRATERARHRSQCHRGGDRCEPPLAEHSSAVLFGLYFGTSAVAVPAAVAG